MLTKFYNILYNSKIYYKSAFSVYFFSSILSIICWAIFSYLILIELDEFDKGLNYLLLSLIVIFIALCAENIRLKNNFFRYLFVCSIIIVSGFLIYIYIIKFFESSDIANLRYWILMLSLFVLFASFNLRFNFYSFFNFVSGLYVIFLFVFLFAILIGISFSSINYLFDINYTILYKTYIICLAFILTIAYIFFIGKISLLNHYLIETKENVEIIKSKIINYLFLVFCIFSYFYASILIIYFLLLFFGLIIPQYSAIHLIVWFSFFGILLFWLNKPLDVKYLGRFFLILLFILDIIALYSILIRIGEYGVTPIRYFVFVSCVFLFISIIFSLLFHYYLKILFCIFSLLCIVSLFGSFSAINVSITSQLNELKKMELKKENIDRISDIYNFLIDYLSYDELKEYKNFLDSNSALPKYTYTYNNPRLKYFDKPNVLDVKGFDVLIRDVSLYDNVIIQGYKFVLDSNRLLIYKNGEILLDIPNLYNLLASKIDNKMLIINLNYHSNKFRFYIVSTGDNKSSIESISFDVLIKHNSNKK